ncbi:TerB family tellurite resistance protein [Chloroflexus sp.]|uniref:TerB family tellurite resistance protein n=1 Tax=Chloroflexus sp. TaxID=1904827 RepID=UPI003C789D50
MLAWQVTQRLIKATISKWLPIVGAVAVAAWSYSSTNQIGQKAVEIFNKDIQIVSEQDAQPEEWLNAFAQRICYAQYRIRIADLNNLVKIDGNVTPEEQTFLSQTFQESGLSDQQARILLAVLHTNTNFTIDYEALAAQPEEIVGLLMKMVALARCDGELHIAEKLYITQMAQRLGIAETDLNELFR